MRRRPKLAWCAWNLRLKRPFEIPPTRVTSKSDFVQSGCCGRNNGHEFCSCSTIWAKESEVRGFGHDAPRRGRLQATVHLRS